MSSAATTSAVPSASISRAEASPAWPNGVAPSNSRPPAHDGTAYDRSIADDRPRLTVAAGARRTRHQPRPAGSGRRLRARRPPQRLGDDRRHHRAGRGDPVPEPAARRPTPGTPIFDEKHYAPQAWQVLHNSRRRGQPRVRPGGAPADRQAADRDRRGASSATTAWAGGSPARCWAWCMVALVARIVRRISRSTLVGGIAGLLLIADGVSFVAARTALLDGFLTFFVVAAFGALIVDRDQVRERMHNALLEGRIDETPWGPRLGVRWWRFGAGVLLGLACATKWSGLYFIVFFGADVAGVRRRRAAAVPGAAAVAGHDPTRPRADRVRVGAHPVRGVPGVLLRRGSPPRPRSTGTRWGRRSASAHWYPAAGRDPVAVALHLQGVRLPFRPDELRGQPPPVGIQTVDLADVAAAGAVRDRPAERRRAAARSPA